MRTKLKLTEGIFPMPVLMIATYNEDGSVNVMNAAWGTMVERDIVALNLSEGHKTVQNIKARGAFTVSIADAAHVVEADYFGVESGNRVSDKLAGWRGRAGRRQHDRAACERVCARPGAAQRPDRRQGRSRGRPRYQRVPPLPGVRVHRVSGRRVWLRRHRPGGERHRR